MLGIFSLLLLLYAKTSLKRETDRSDRLEAENRELNRSIQEQIIPALISSNAALQASSEVLATIQRRLELEMIDPHHRRARTEE